MQAELLKEVAGLFGTKHHRNKLEGNRELVIQHEVLEPLSILTFAVYANTDIESSASK